jgi:hypothetical protein
MKKILLLALFLATLSVVAIAQANNKSVTPLLVSPSKFKLLATNVSYQGKTCSPSDKNDKTYSGSSEVIRVGDDVYYQAHRFYRHGRGGGLVEENFAAKTCRIYPMFDLAKAAGWFKPKAGEGGTPDATGGLFQVGNSLWMGSNGIGVAVFDLERKTWSRFDLKSSVVAGDHVYVNYANDDYAFVTRGEFPDASLHIYSVKHNKWLGLKAVSTKLVRQYGFNWNGDGLPMVQVIVDHRVFAKQEHMPVDWTFMGLQVTQISGGKSYLFEKNFSGTKTVFEISKSQLEQVFIKSL